MGVARAEDRDEAKDIALHAEGFAVGGDQSFAGQLGRAVKRGLQGERRIFRGGNHRASPYTEPVEENATRRTPLRASPRAR